MSVRSVDQLGSGTRSFSINSQFEKVLRRTYMVIADNGDDEETVRANCGISLFSGHPSDAFARVRSISGDHVDTILMPDVGAGLFAKWVVTVEYGYINPFEAAASGDPSDCPIEVTIEGVNGEKLVDFDKDGNPILNSAGEQFDPPIAKDEYRRVIKIGRNEKTLTLAQLFGTKDVVNQSVWQGLPAKSVKMSPPTVTPRYSQFLNVIYYKVQRVFEYNPDTWTAKPVDAGLNALDMSTTPGQLKRLLDRYGQVVETPALLDGHGNALPLPATKDSAVYLNFDIYDELDFDTLGFPDNIFVTNPFG